MLNVTSTLQPVTISNYTKNIKYADDEKFIYVSSCISQCIIVDCILSEKHFLNSPHWFVCLTTSSFLCGLYVFIFLYMISFELNAIQLNFAIFVVFCIYIYIYIYISQYRYHAALHQRLERRTRCLGHPPRTVGTEDAVQ